MLSGWPKTLTLAPRTRSLLQIFQINLGVVPRYESLQLRGREHPDPLRLDDGTEAANEGSCLVLDLRVHSKVGHQMDVANSVTDRGKQQKLTGQRGWLPTGWTVSPVSSEASLTQTQGVPGHFSRTTATRMAALLDGPRLASGTASVSRASPHACLPKASGSDKGLPLHRQEAQ